MDELVAVVVLFCIASLLLFSFISLDNQRDKMEKFCNSYNMKFYDWTTSTTACFDEKTNVIKAFPSANS